jgi:outer membrane receptor protein involved in Fe transport
MNKLLFICLFIFIHISCLGQTGTVSGIVRDSLTGEILPGATVAFNKIGTTTNSEGFYSVELNEAKYSLKFSFVGYETKINNFNLLAGQNLILNALLSSKQNELNPIVISASRFGQNLSELSVSMEVLKPSIIQNRNTTQIDEVLQQVPGLNILAGEPQIRNGSGYSYGAGSRVMILIDDLPILSGDIGRPVWGFIPFENVEQVEILKGASSVLYGSAALSGVINVRSALAGQKPTTNITVFSGIYSAPKTSENLYWRENDFLPYKKLQKNFHKIIDNPMQMGANFSHSRKIKNLDFSLGGNFFSDMGYTGSYYQKDADGNPINFSIEENGDTTKNTYDGFEQRARLNFNLGYKFKKAEGLFIGLRANGMLSDGASALLWHNADSGLYRPANGSLTRTIQETFYLDPYIKYISPKGVSQQFNFRWFGLNNENDNKQANSSDLFFSEYRINFPLDSFGIKKCFVSAGLANSSVKSTSEIFKGNPGESGKGSGNNYALYLQLQNEIIKNLNVSFGVRHEFNKVNFDADQATILRGGINYQVAKATWLRASAGQGIRFATIGERYITTSVGSLNIYPNIGLKPEKSLNTEIGLRHCFNLIGITTFLDVALFQQYYNNFIEFTFGQWADTATFDNLFGLGFKSLNTGKAKIYGIDCSLSLTGFIDKVKLSGLLGYTYSVPKTLSPDYVYGKSSEKLGGFSSPLFKEVNYLNSSSNTSNNILKYRMQHLFKADLEMEYKVLSFGVSARYNSRINNIDNIFLQLDYNVDNPTDPIPDLLNSGINQWRKEHNSGDYVFDVRIGFIVSSKSKIALVCNNLFNREYSTRPLNIEAPRLTFLQYSYKL